MCSFTWAGQGRCGRVDGACDRGDGVGDEQRGDRAGPCRAW